MAPTVTMPRLKALTTGSPPNFLDVLSNLDGSTSLLHVDSWLHQFKSAGKRLHFYGDDTWLKLFPDYFQQFDGTTSFFVQVQKITFFKLKSFL
jgi:predicted AlkP superfamily pyrophosphatase or phosphodiesterase